MITSIYLKEHEYLTNKPQTLNFGGKYLYTFIPFNNNLILRRKLNDKYLPDFFNISDSECQVNLLSAIVGKNGVGKSSVLDIFRKIFVEYEYSMPYNSSTILVEANGETKVLYSKCKVFLLKDDNLELTDESIQLDFKLNGIIESEQSKLSDMFEELDKIDLEEYQTIYYSPHFDLKYNDNFSDVDKYDISLDQFIKYDLEYTDKKGTNENGFRFDFHEEMVFKNSMRQIEFLGSSIYRKNEVFREVFDLPQYETGILHFRDVEIPDYHNTPIPLRPIISLIFTKVDEERKNWHIYRDKNQSIDDNLLEALVNKYLLKRFVIKAFLSIVVQHMEKDNTWLYEGKIENHYDIKQLDKFTASEVLFFFIKESYISKGAFKKPIFNHEEILPFFEKLNLLFDKETKRDYITQQSIRLEINEVREIMQLHEKIIINLRHYYPLLEGLIQKRNYIDGFISFRPTDRNMSSGENALLNFFSKLNNFIQNNLIEESKSLPNKSNYILLLDEADLGFHPVWKKKYVLAILKTIPYFFEFLKVKPKLQIIITTHDPLTLSDFPTNNVVFLEKDNEYCTVVSDNDKNKIQKTFGANITNLLAHSFFVENGLIGDFSRQKIKETIDWITRSRELSTEKKSTIQFKSSLEYYKKVISLIDEKVVKLKLSEMITDITTDYNYYNQIIDNEIKYLQNKKRRK